MIQNLKDLKALLKLCRQNGVTKINLGGVNCVQLEIGAEPKMVAGEIEDSDDNGFAEALEVPLTNEELVSFANGGDLT